ncbi:helix-turn-helix domain-containing protein [Sphingobacterium hungaricum]
MEYSSLFYAFSAGALLLLAFLLIKQVPAVNERSNRWLILFSFCLSCLFCQLFLEFDGRMGTNPTLIIFLELSRWAIMPSFYLAVTAYIHPFRKQNSLLHFIPSVLFLFYTVAVLIPNAIHAGAVDFDLPRQAIWIIASFFPLQIFFYGTLSLLQIHRHQKIIQQTNSTIDEINLVWIQKLFASYVLLVALWALSKFFPSVIYFVPIGYFAVTLYMAYSVTSQKNIDEKDVRISADASGNKSSNERLHADQVELVMQRVDQYMQAEKVFLDPALNLTALATALELTTHELSYVINTGFKKNFYQFVNEMRVDEAKKLLMSKEHRHLDMIGIATLAGFNSKTTFNTTFKRITGETPTEFYKENQN